MTLTPGEAWGELGLLPIDAPIVATDAELATLLNPGEPGLTVGLAGGDLCRTLGGRGDVAKRLGKQTTLAKVDVCLIRLDDRFEHIFVAHAIARGRLWSGSCRAIMNAERLGEWQIAPRAHPGDGLLDIVEGQLGTVQRVLAARRARSGQHVPHPNITTERRSNTLHVFERPRRVYLDGTYIGRFSRVEAVLNGRSITVAV